MAWGFGKYGQLGNGHQRDSKRPVAVQLPHAAARDAKPGVHPIRFEIDRVAASGGDARVVEKSTFIIPR